MTERQKKTLRCVIYTRKSSEEGLEQEFNSLEAQREACEAYIRSQAHEGWRLVSERFDDGGFSGGTLERPALQRLLQKIREKRVDVIVIYKIDRLTRSLMDFAKLAELFESEGVSFVSVTQQFSTTTSMGRLMLNVLLSFAQFEREITGERIRDKIAASKKKGIWMGGNVPIGYEFKDRALIINDDEAETVRTIFRLYLEQGNVRKVWVEAGRLGLKTKVRPKSDGRIIGGNRFFPGHIYSVLKCPIYVGRIHHKGETFPGNHAAIIDSETWDAVQARLAGNRVDRRSYPNAKDPSPLVGLIFDSKGTRFTPTHTSKGGKRYRYYVDQALTKGITPATADIPRIPAMEIEHIVRKGFADFLANTKNLLDALGDGLNGVATERALKQARALEAELRAATPSSWMPLIRPALQQIVIEERAIRLRIVRDGLRTILSPQSDHNLAQSSDDTEEEYRQQICEHVIAARMRTRSGVIKLIIGNGAERTMTEPDLTLCKMIARAHGWIERLSAGHVHSVRALAKAEGITESYVTRVLRLGFLAPSVVDTILDGRHPVEITADQLTLREDIPTIWVDQRRQLGFDPV
ncbi:MAG: recombinase family protein [Alphaproteobacteria bacterium]|nr:recombinase family protein [Alphaproteobacteria bacterium]